MAGLMEDHFKEEVLIELSWIMNVIDEISQKYGIETYETVLIKYRIQPEEEKAIDKFMTFHVKDLDNLKTEEIHNKIASYFFQLTGKEWTVSNEIVEKLIQLKRTELGM